MQDYNMHLNTDEIPTMNREQYDKETFNVQFEDDK